MNILRRLTDEEFQALRQYWWMSILLNAGWIGK